MYNGPYWWEVLSCNTLLCFWWERIIKEASCAQLPLSLTFSQYSSYLTGGGFSQDWVSQEDYCGSSQHFYIRSYCPYHFLWLFRLAECSLNKIQHKIKPHWATAPFSILVHQTQSHYKKATVSMSTQDIEMERKDGFKAKLGDKQLIRKGSLFSCIRMHSNENPFQTQPTNPWRCAQTMRHIYTIL